MTLEQLGEDQLFLVCHSVHVDSFALNRSIEIICSFLCVHDGLVLVVGPR